MQLKLNLSKTEILLAIGVTLLQCLSLCAMCNWFMEWLHMPPFIPLFFNGEFNIALCFFLISTAFLLQIKNQFPLLKIILTVIVIVIGIISFFQYSFNFDFNIDSIFVEPLLIKNSRNSHMSLHTASEFIFLSLSMLFCSLNWGCRRSKTLSISISSSAAFALGLTPLLGYLVSIEPAYNWDEITSNSIETSAGFVLLSTLIIGYIWQYIQKDILCLTSTIFIISFSISISMSTALYHKEQLNFNFHVRNNSQNAAMLVKEHLNNLVLSLTRMAHRWEDKGDSPIKLWNMDGQAYLRDFPFLHSIVILNNKFQIEASAKKNHDKILDNNYFQALSNDKNFINKLLTFHFSMISYSNKKNNPLFLCSIPLFVNHEFVGILNAFFTSEDFFNSLFSKFHFSGFDIDLYENNLLIYSNKALGKASAVANNIYYPINYKNIQWSVFLSPHHNMFIKQLSNSYIIVLGFSLLMTLLLTLCVFLILNLLRNNQALNEGDTRYRMLLDSIKDYAIFMLTPEGFIKNWNNSAKNILGYNDDEIIGEHLSIFYSIQDNKNEIPQQNLDDALLYGQFANEEIKLRKDGTAFFANNLLEPLYDHHKKLVGYVNVIRDLSVSKKLEQEHAKLITLIEESADFIAIADLTGHIQYLNRSAKLMLGLSENCDLSTLTIADTHPKEVSKKILHEALPSLYKNGVWNGESILLHKNGTEIPVLQSINLQRDTFGNPICFTTIIRDISERIIREQALKTSEETFRSAMQNASIGMALVSPQGKWLKVNQSLCQMVGYSESQLLNMDFQSITYKEDLSADLEQIELMINNKIDNYQIEKRYVHYNGSILWCLLNVSLLRDGKGNPQYFITQIQNITDSKMAEVANKKLISALASSNSELERFAYVASHDLQEPIRMINSFVELLQTEKKAAFDEEALEYLNIMANAGIRMRDMIQDLLTYSRIDKEKTKLVFFDCEELLLGVLQNIKSLIDEHHASITYDHLPQLFGNPTQLMRLFQNLISNAIKYQKPQTKPIIHIGIAENTTHWIISIKDNGMGIEKNFTNEIFEPFRRLHTWERIKGSGLGLSICKKIAEHHHGTLTVESTPGEGSIFYLTLPKTDED